MDIETYITTLQELAQSLPKEAVNRRDTARIRSIANQIQTSCQHIFTEVKALNRVLPQ